MGTQAEIQAARDRLTKATTAKNSAPASGPQHDAAVTEFNAATTNLQKVQQS